MGIHTSLHERVREHSRAANALMAEKGARQWTPKDQAEFDAHIDKAEAAQRELEAVELRELQLVEAQNARSAAFAAARTGRMLATAPSWRRGLHQAGAQHREVLDIYLRKDKTRMSAEEVQRIRAAMSTTTGSEGGFAVGQLVADDCVSLLQGYGYMRAVATPFVTQDGAAMGYPTSDGRTEEGEQLAENQPATALDPTFGTRAVPTYRYSSKLFTAPVQLVQDAQFDLVSFFMLRMRERIGRTQNRKFTLGTGTGEPLGLVPAAAVGKTGATGSSATFTHDDLVDLMESVDAAHYGMPSADSPHSSRAGWMMSQAARKLARKLKDTNGRPIWMPSSGVGPDGQSAPPMLLDHPVHMNADMPAPGANAKSVAFGDFSRYLVRDVVEMVAYRFEDSAFALRGQVGFIGFMRSGGTLLDLDAVKTFQHSAT